MTNRTELCQIRAALEAIEGQLRTVEQTMPGRVAAAHLSKARGLIGGAGALVSAALRTQLEPSAAAPR